MQIGSPGELRPYVSRLPSGLHLLAAPPDPAVMAQMTPELYGELLVETEPAQRLDHVRAGLSRLQPSLPCQHRRRVIVELLRQLARARRAELMARGTSAGFDLANPVRLVLDVLTDPGAAGELFFLRYLEQR